MRNTYKEDYYLILIFIIISVSILISSYFNPDGYLSADSAQYLSVAQNLMNFDGYVIPSKRGQPFAIWPIGYPTFIALISFITGLSIFWSSKLLSIILIGLNFLILRKYYKENTYLVAIVFTWGSYITIYFYTWSETIFIFGLILFCVSIYDFFNSENPNFSKYALILLSMFLLFFSRYIGAFSFVVVGLIGLYYLYRKRYIISFKLFTLSIISIMIMMLYFYINYKMTGFYTGIERIEAPEKNSELFSKLIKILFYELVIPMNWRGFRALPIFLVEFMLFAFLCKKYGDIKSKSLSAFLLEKIFLSIGIVFLFSIILIRWFVHFDDFNFRLLGPGTILIHKAFLGFLIKSKIIFDNKWIKYFFVLFSIVSIVLSYNSIYITYKQYKGTYEGYISLLKNQLKEIPKNSIVLFPEIHIYYLRLDLDLYTPYYQPYHKKREPISDFFNRVCNDKNKRIFIDTQNNVENGIRFYDDSIITFYNSLPKNKRFYEYKCQ